MYFIIIPIIILSHGKMKVLAIMVYYPGVWNKAPPTPDALNKGKSSVVAIVVFCVVLRRVVKKNAIYHNIRPVSSKNKE